MKTAFWTWVTVWPLSMGAGGFVRQVLAEWPAWLQGGATSALIVVGLTWVVRPLARRVREAF